MQQNEKHSIMAHLDNAVATEEFKHMNNLLEPIALVSYKI